MRTYIYTYIHNVCMHTMHTQIYTHIYRYLHTLLHTCLPVTSLQRGIKDNIGRCHHVTVSPHTLTLHRGTECRKGARCSSVVERPLIMR